MKKKEIAKNACCFAIFLVCSLFFVYLAKSERQKKSWKV
jgi:preprotein translocase subunit SecG